MERARRPRRRTTLRWVLTPFVLLMGVEQLSPVIFLCHSDKNFDLSSSFIKQVSRNKLKPLEPSLNSYK